MTRGQPRYAGIAEVRRNAENEKLRGSPSLRALRVAPASEEARA